MLLSAANSNTGCRSTATTSWPWERSSATAALPSLPRAPVTQTFIGVPFR